jgi:diguanylate cyclase (GGDEF)-like protein
MTDETAGKTLIPYKIVLVDDSLFIRKVTKDCLADERHVVIEAENGAQARELIKLVRPDLIVLDVELPDVNGIDLCAEIRADSSFRFTPVIILTSNYELEQIVEGYRRGADDYISKDPFNAKEFELRVKARVQRASMLREEATVDALTGCSSRRVLFERLDDELYRFRRYDQSFSLMICDLDDFKKINDKFGHIAGDIVLKEFAFFLKSSFRISEVVARYGGEEFAVLMPATDFPGAGKAALRWKQLWNAKNLVIPQYNGELRVTFCGGLTRVVSDDDNNSIMERADRNLYAAKRSGKDAIFSDTGRLTTDAIEKAENLSSDTIRANNL